MTWRMTWHMTWRVTWRVTWRMIWHRMTITALARGVHGDGDEHLPRAVRSPALQRVRAQGRAVQVDPIKSTFKAPGSERLKLKYDEPVSNVAFRFSLRRYTKVDACPLCRRAIHDRVIIRD